LLAPSPASAIEISGTYSNGADSNNQATGFPSGPFSLTSTASTYSFVEFTPGAWATVNSITSLSATFTDTAGGAYGGSPRIELDLNNGGWFLVYLGTPPSFNDSNPATFTADFSNFNLTGGTNDTAYENGNTYSSFASFDALYG